MEQLQVLEKHIDGEWWTKNYLYKDRKLMIKMRKGHGCKIHIWNQVGDKVIKTFRYYFAEDEFLLKKATVWIDSNQAIDAKTL